MEIIQKFGLEVRLFLFQSINFLVMAFILKKFLYIPLKKVLDERKLKIEESLKDAERIKKSLENASKDGVKILEEAKNNANKLMSVVKASAVDARKKVIAEARYQSEQIIVDAKQRAEVEIEGMSKQVCKVSLEISEKLISKILPDLFTEYEKQKLIARALEKIYEKVTN
jgi:F-type H+-transporting ATPase subunit b